MCAILKEPIKGGQAKKYQLLEWERYIKFTKEGNKFIIKEIYSEPLEKIDNRADGKNSPYSQYIQILILNLLAEYQYKSAIFLSTNQLLKVLEMINANYSPARNNIPKLSKLIDIDEKYIYDFYDNTQSNLKCILETALNQLERKSLLFWSKEITVCVSKASIKRNDLGDAKIIETKNKEDEITQNIHYTINKDYREATEEEINLILKTEKDVLLEMGLNEKQDAIAFNKWTPYIKRVNQILKEKANIEFYYKSYKIISNKEYVLKELDDIEKFIAMNTLNTKIIINFAKNAENRHIKTLTKIVDYEKFNSKDYLRAEPEYLENTYKLINTLINNKAKDITKEFKVYKLKPTK